MNSQSTKPLTPQKFHLPSSPFHLPPPGFGALGRGNHLGTVLVGWWMVCVALAFVPSHIYLSALAQNQPSRAGDLAHAGSYWVTRASWAERRAEEGGAEGGMEWRKGDRVPGWETRSRSIFPSSLSVMSSHFVRFCWWHTFSAHRPISRPGEAKKKKKKKVEVCALASKLHVWACVSGGRAHAPEGCQSWLLSSCPLPQDCERADERPLRWAPLLFLSPERASRGGCIQSLVSA